MITSYFSDLGLSSASSTISSSIGLLTYLKDLNINSNLIQGYLPSSIGDYI